MCAFYFMCYTCHLSIYVCLYVIRWGTVHWQYASRGLVSYYLVLCMFYTLVIICNKSVEDSAAIYTLYYYCIFYTCSMMTGLPMMNGLVMLHQ